MLLVEGIQFGHSLFKFISQLGYFYEFVALTMATKFSYHAQIIPPLLSNTSSARYTQREIMGKFLSFTAIHFIIISLQPQFIYMRKIIASLNNLSHLQLPLNAFQFTSTQTKLFKKPPKHIQQVKATQQRVQYKDSEISKLLCQYQQYFKQQRQSLPTYLRRVWRVINKQSIVVHKEKFHLIYYQLNRCSSQLVLKSHQYLEIIIFIGKYLSHTHSPLDQTFNNGFEHRATMLAATFLLNQQFSITQAIAIYQILTRIGCVSMLFVVNLTKFLKVQLQKGNEVKIEHIVVILESYYLKKNHTILENVLCDMTLHYLLQHHQLMNQASNTVKVQLACLLLPIDLPYFYLTQEPELTLFTNKLIRQIAKTIQRKDINLNHFIYLTQSYRYTKRYHKNRFLDDNSFKEIQSIERSFIAQNKDIHMTLLMRNLVNGKLSMQKWIKQIENMFQRCDLEQSVFYAVVDQYYERQGKGKDQMVLVIKTIWQQMVKKQLFLPAIAKIVIQNTQGSRILTVLKQIKASDSAANILPLYALLMFVTSKHLLKDHPQMNNLQQGLLNKIQKLKADNLQFINGLYYTINAFRDPFFPSKWLTSIITMNWTKYFKITHPSLPVRDRYEVSYIFITSFLITNHPNISLPIFKQHNIYSYLLLLYPQRHPAVNEYHKRVNFLSNDSSFQNNIGIVDRLMGNLDKYYYLFWDIFISNYVQKSSTVRKTCFGLLRRYFLRAYEKQSARKVVLLTILTNYLSSGIVVAQQNQLQQLLELCLEPLVSDQIKDKFHYHCFLQIVFNCRSANILTSQYFTKIIVRWLSSQNCEAKSFKTSTLMLLYGQTLKNRPQNYYIEYYGEQRQYLKDMLNKKLVKIEHVEADREDNRSRKYVIAGNKFVCVLLEFGQVELLPYKQQILKFIKDRFIYGQIMQLIYSFKPSNYDLRDKELNKALVDKVQYLQKSSLIDKHNFQVVVSYLQENEGIINDNL